MRQARKTELRKLETVQENKNQVTEVQTQAEEQRKKGAQRECHHHENFIYITLKRPNRPAVTLPAYPPPAPDYNNTFGGPRQHSSAKEAKRL